MCSDVFINYLLSIITHILQMRKPRLKQAKLLAQGHTAKVNTNNMNHGNNLKSMLNFNLLSLFFLSYGYAG